MVKTHIAQKLVLSAMAGMIMIPGSAFRVSAAEASDEQAFVEAAGIESVLEECYETEVKDNLNLYLVPTEEGEYLNMAFSDTGEFTYIRSAPDENSDWVGKLYEDSAAQVLEYLDGWTRIRSGSAEGYVPADTLLTGAQAQQHAGEYRNSTVTVTAYALNVRDGQGTDANILTQITRGREYEMTGEPVDGWYPVKVDGIDGWVSGKYVEAETSFSYGETKEEEEERIREEEERKAQEEAGVPVNSSGVSGQDIIDYACRFIGNPYVWGGTSLTEGTDCSGFAQSVYAHFGVSIPRTTSEQVYAGYGVSYDDAQPGDMIFYGDGGHVGLYMGDGNIVNAMNPDKGICVCSATYTNIYAVRRVL